jgi:proline dehydrogenase
MEDERNRWALPDWDSAVNWCRKRNSQGIRCTIDLLGENKKTEEDTKQYQKEYTQCINRIRKENLKASLAVKLSALGANVDHALCERNLHDILKEAQKNQVLVEIDIEGTPLVDFTIDTAIRLAKEGFLVILALQAYLERTPEDLNRVLSHEITVRIVKGAYKGDISDFIPIQERFKELLLTIQERKVPFIVGTHDPELIEWIQRRANKLTLEFGFLKGLADKTKHQLIDEDWLVSEYLPFGKDVRTYETRRRRYLSELEKLGREPTP